MSVAIAIPQLQHLPDVNVAPGASVDGYALVYDSASSKFIARPEYHVETYDYQRTAFVTGMGDSITGGTGASDAPHRWLNLLQASIDAASGMTSTLTNSGVAGNESQAMALRLEGTERRGVVAILAGINDMRHGRSVASFIDNLGAIIDFYQAAAHIIVVGSLVHVSNYAADPPYNVGTDAANHLYNTAIQTLCTQRGVLFADVHTAMNHDDALVSADGIHPNDAGHQRIKDAFWTVLSPYFAASSPVVARFPLARIQHLPIANPRFGQDYTVGWSYYQATIAEELSIVMAGGLKSQKVTITTSPGVCDAVNLESGSRPAWFPSTRTFVEAWVKADVTTSPINCFIRTNEYNAARSFIGGSTNTAASVAVTSSAWVRLTSVFTTTSTCRGLEVNVGAEGIGSIMYIGQVKAWSLVPVVSEY